MAAETVTDAWAGDRDWLVQNDPFLGKEPDRLAPDAHEHFHHDGCRYIHAHPLKGPHAHTFRCESPDCNHVSRRT